MLLPDSIRMLCDLAPTPPHLLASVLLALLLDRWLGEPRRAHPLVAFGRLTLWLEARLYAAHRLRGLLAASLLLLPAVLLCLVLLYSLEHTLGPLAATVASSLILWLCIGQQSLDEHARPVATALAAGELTEARRLAARIVSRDEAHLQPAAATCESVLENGSDALFVTLFWFLLLGAPGALLHRLANTLDAMWGYRNARYGNFGWAAARLDDLLGYVPARLTALSYALVGQTRQALACWRRQAPQWESPNAGPVMAAGAGALGLSLGGPACYDGQWHQRPPLGAGKPPTATDIHRALALIRRALWLWLAVLAAATLVSGLTGAPS